MEKVIRDIKQFVKPFIWEMRYAGFGSACNICGKTFRKFRPHGHTFSVLSELDIVGGRRIEKGKCPYCHRNERERLVYWFLFQSGRINLQNLSILHIAPESSIFSKFQDLTKTKALDYRAGDLFTEGYDYDCELVDITETKFADSTFDFIICNHVLEHILNDRKAMLEMFRILKPGGKALLQVPISFKLNETMEDFSITDPKEREERYGQFDHVRVYGRDYKNRLESVGFKVEILNPNTMMNATDFSKFGFNPKERLFFARKS